MPTDPDDTLVPVHVPRRHLTAVYGSSPASRPPVMLKPCPNQPPAGLSQT